MRSRMSRVAVVTGGASGVGRAVCEHLARAGHPVAVLDLDGAGAVATAEALQAAGANAIGLQLDTADRAAVRRTFDDARERLGPVQVLVTSAAVSGFTPFEA